MTVVQCELILNRQHYVSVVLLDDISASCGLAATKMFTFMFLQSLLTDFPSSL